MTDVQPKLGEQLVPLVGLHIPEEVAAALPEAIRAELAHLPEAKQREFLSAFERRSASVALAYLGSLVYCHYGLLGRWTMTGWMWLSLFVASSLGMVWWLIDLVRIPRMVREHNSRIAADIVRQLSVPAAGPAQPAGS